MDANPSNTLFGEDALTTFALPTHSSLTRKISTSDLPSSAFGQGASDVIGSLEDMFNLPSQSYLDEPISLTGPLSPCRPSGSLPPPDTHEPSSPTTDSTPFLSSPLRAASPVPASPGPCTPAVPEIPLAANPTAYPFALGPELDDEELDEYLDHEPYRTLIHPKVPAPDPPMVYVPPTTTQSEPHNSPLVLPIPSTPSVNTAPSARKRDGKRKRQQVRDEDKENSEPEDSEPVAGSSTVPVIQPPRKRAKHEEVLQNLVIPTDGPAHCGLDQGTCMHQLTQSEADGDHLNRHVVVNNSGVILCTWPGCTATFKKPDGLPRHVKDKHWGWRFVCERCGDDFGRHDLLKKHQKKCP